MNTTKRISVIVLLICLSCAAYFSPPIVAQQNSATPDVEREFFDAIKKGDSEKVVELLRQRPTLIQASTKNGTTPVLYAVFTNHHEIAESLLATGIEPNIFEAAAMGRAERIRALLRNDPTLIKAYSPDGWTALHLNWGNPQTAELLLDSGADINAVSKNKFIATPPAKRPCGKVDSGRPLSDRARGGGELPKRWRIQSVARGRQQRSTGNRKAPSQAWGKT